MKRLGPDLKVPDLKGLKDLKPPAALADVYYDLRDRRLLPVVALVLVAIVAVPFLLGSSGGEPVAPSSLPGAGTALEEGVPGTRKLTVVEATPGVREYHKRLAGRTPTDPFKQRYASVPEKAQLESSLSNSPSSETSTTSSEEKATVDSTTVKKADPGGSGKSGGGSQGNGKPAGSHGDQSDGAGSAGSGIRILEFRFDIQISRTEASGDGRLRWSSPQVRRRVPSLTQLPGKQTAVVTVGGINLSNGKVFILVSDNVRSLDGEFVCKTRTEGNLCELLELREGSLLKLVSGPNDVRYRIKVIGIDTVPAGKPRAQKRSRVPALGGPTGNTLPTP